MNTIGKILVILNFLFAVIVGILLVLNVGVRNYWKEKYVELEAQARVAIAQRDAHAKMNQKLTNDFRSMRTERDDMAQLLDDKKTEINAIEKVYAAKTEDFKNQTIAAQTALQQALAAKQRMTDEIGILKKTIDDREGTIVKIEAEYRTIRVQAQNFESLARARQIQNENLLEQIREFTRYIARLEAGVNPNATVARNPNDPNPPAVAVEGRIERVDDKDNTLVQITLGTDHGVNKHHTLDVFRLQPEPKYLGMVRILEAYHQRSVGQLVTSGNAAYRPVLRANDIVASKIRQ